MKILKFGAVLTLPLSALLLFAILPVAAQTTAPPWHNPDLDVPPAAAPAPPPAAAPAPPPAPAVAPPPAPAPPPVVSAPPPSLPPAALASPAPPPTRMGTVAPIRSDLRAECREFQQNIMIGGQQTKAYGTACRQADGTWKIVH